jgi:hypothetical protein
LKLYSALWLTSLFFTYLLTWHLILCLHALQSDRFFNALKGHGALCRLVILPFESHGYASRESIMHVLWETDRWLQKYCVSNTSVVKADIDVSKPDVSKEAADSESKAASASGGGGPEVSDFEHEGFYSMPRSSLW